ncbi:MAG: GNAT family N-acetyltransferase [Clostridia bacterium]|nr:GNAT family N-acetyltransferase [Clostridia bacterium]
MEIRQITENKKQFLELLLLADEQESMIDRYLASGDTYVLYENGRPLGICVVVCLGDGVFEIKNLATHPSVHGMGYGRALIEFVCDRYRDRCTCLLVGTGDSPLTIPFYQKCGFAEHHRVENFFIDNYDHPILEGGKQLIDMVYLSRKP